jgi:hypothetical protein
VMLVMVALLSEFMLLLLFNMQCTLSLWTQIEFCLSPKNNSSLIHFGYLHLQFKCIGHSFLFISIPLKFTNQIHSQWVYL